MAIAQALVGALRASLSLDTAAFEEGSKRASSLAAGLSKNLKGIFAGITAAAGIAGVGAAIKSVIDKADQLHQVSQKIGVSVETLSTLEHAARITDVSIGELTAGFARLARVQSEALSGSKGAIGTFQALGISLQQLKTLGPEQLMATLADRFASMESGAKETALAMKIFGRAGFEMLPFLNLGSQGINELREQAKRLGLEISSRTAAAADAFNDNMQSMQTSLSGITTILVSQFLPVLARLSERFLKFILESDGVQRAAAGISRFIETTIKEFKILNSFVFRAGELFTTLKKVLEAIGTGRQLEIWAAGMASIRAEAARLNAELNLSNLTLSETAVSAQIAASRISTGAGAPSFGGEGFGEGISTGGGGAASKVKETREEMEKLKPISEEILGLFQNVGSTIADVFFAAIDGTKSLAEGFKDMVTQILRDMTRMLADRAFQMIFSTLLSGFGGGPTSIVPTGFSSFFSGGLASGGKVKRGRTYLVGERGAEMFMPRTSGTIIPNSALGGGGAGVTIIDQRTTASPPVETRRGADGSSEFVIRDMVRRQLPGELNRIMPSQFGARPRLNQRGS